MSRRLAGRICDYSVQPIVSPAANDGPRLWIVAGPNGSGKTSIYGDADIEDFGRSVWIINPDALAKRIADVERLEPLPANLEAVRRIEQWLYASIQAHQTVGVETVLLAQLPWFLAQADDGWLFDNSGERPQLIGTKSKGGIELEANALPEIVEAARLARLESGLGEAALP
jgi:predicted ABC-type ATPase